MNPIVVGALTTAIGTALGAALSFGGVTLTARRNEKLAKEARASDRYDHAVEQIRSALFAIRFMDPELYDRHAPAPNLFYQLHTIDSFVHVFKSEELRQRLNAATSIMGNWDWFHHTRANPIWVGSNHAQECLGAFLRDEPLPEEFPVFRQFREEIEWLEEQAEEHLAETDGVSHP